MTIYDVAGSTIKQIQLGYLTAGSYNQTEKGIYWDRKTKTSEAASSGTYFHQLLAGDYTSLSPVTSVVSQ